MQGRTRILVLVFLAAAAAAVATVGLTALTSDPKPTAEASCPDGPPLALDLGLRTDPEAVALRRAQARLAAGDTDAAREVFRQYRSVDAQVGAAVAGWPGETMTDLRALATRRPRNATVALHLGSALYCDRRVPEAQAQWRRAERLAPDGLMGVRAADFLNPQYPIPGLPVFVPDFAAPAGLAALPPPKQFELLAARARRPDVRSKLLYGVALQKLSRPRSAERAFAEAARLAPDDAEAQVAEAVGRFDKNRPSDAFSRLGPLARRFPKSASVRFHLGLLLLWLGRVDEAERQLRQASALAPKSRIGRQAARFLAGLDRQRGSGSGSSPSS